MKPLSLHVQHLAFPAFDPEATWRFYEEVMRLPLTDVISVNGDDPWLMMTFTLADGRQLAFFTVKHMEPREQDGVPDWIYHSAFSAESAGALQDWKRHLRKLDVEFSEEDHDGRQSIYLTDPNGITLEVHYPPQQSGPAASAEGALQRMRRWMQANRQ